MGAVIMAAGRSQRMGRPKMTLPWGKTTVIGQVVQTLAAAGVDPVVAVTGGAEVEVTESLRNLPVTTVRNPLYAQSEMLTSLQTGLRVLPEDVDGVLICLGDQPQIEIQVVSSLAASFRHNRRSLIVPSYKMRRGHPWLVGRELWDEILHMDPESSLRNFLNMHSADITYLIVDTDSILKDLDTPEDYEDESRRLGRN